MNKLRIIMIDYYYIVDILTTGYQYNEPYKKWEQLIQCQSLQEAQLFIKNYIESKKTPKVIEEYTF